MREYIYPSCINQTGILLENQPYTFDSLSLIAYKLINKHDDIFYIRKVFILVYLCHTITNEYQQRILYTEWC